MAVDPPSDELSAARAAKEAFAAQLRANPDVHGIGVGRRRRGGSKTDEFAVVVHVRHKLPVTAVPVDRLIPAELRFRAPDGHEVVARVDVQEHDPPVPEARPSVADLRRKARPTPGGMSAGFSGTVGGWVLDTVTNQPVALSNRHVFGSIVGQGVVQPSTDDGGRLPRDKFAVVLRVGKLDAAIAAPVDNGVVDRSILGGGTGAFRLVDATIDMRVQKTGRTTGLTFGVVDQIDFESRHSGSTTDLWIDGDGSDFSDGGDSGSLYLEAVSADDPAGTRGMVGLHWGGSGLDGVGHPIRAVFEELGLRAM